MTMRVLIPWMLVTGVSGAFAAMVPFDGPYAPPPGMAGSTAVAYRDAEKDPRILGWATGVSSFTAGPTDIQFPEGPFASWGSPTDALGPADGEVSDNLAVVSLGDGGQITLTFAQPFGNGPGPDLAVFENGFEDDFLELAFVEVSSNGTTFHRFPAISLTQTNTQLGGFGYLDTTYVHNLAGKYRRGFGTPFDLAELAGMDELDISAITHVRIVDVVGSLDEAYRRLDSQGNPINDPWTTDFETGGFDLDAVAILSIPEPTASLFWLLGLYVCATRRKRRT
jgi:hypothetical protein